MMINKKLKLNLEPVFKKNEKLRELINQVIVLKEIILKEHDVDLNCNPKMVKKT